MWNITPEENISTELYTMGQSLQSWSLVWFSHLEKMVDNFWPSKYQNFEIGSSLARGRTRKTWTEVIWRDLAEWSQQVRMKFFRKIRLTEPCVENRGETEYDDDYFFSLIISKTVTFFHFQTIRKMKTRKIVCVLALLAGVKYFTLFSTFKKTKIFIREI